MRTRRTRLAALAAVAVLGIAVAASVASASDGALSARPAAAPVGAGCADIPSEGEASVAGMADDRAGTAAANNPDLSTFVGAVDEAGLSAALDGEGPFTLFVPNNAAFEKIPQNVIDSILADADLLNSILTYHVVSGQALAPADLVAAGSVETAGGAVLEVTQEGDVISINGGEATVVCGGIPVANGYLYIIDYGAAAAEQRRRCRRQHEQPEQQRPRRHRRGDAGRRAPGTAVRDAPHRGRRVDRGDGRRPGGDCGHEQPRAVDAGCGDRGRRPRRHAQRRGSVHDLRPEQRGVRGDPPGRPRRRPRRHRAADQHPHLPRRAGRVAVGCRPRRRRHGDDRAGWRA